jgi:hypothetical protein
LSPSTGSKSTLHLPGVVAGPVETMYRFGMAESYP